MLYAGLETAVFVLLLICMLGAFKKRINKVALIVAAALILTGRLISLVSGVFSAISFFYFLAYALLAVTLLLIAILWKKPAEENEMRQF